MKQKVHLIKTKRLLAFILCISFVFSTSGVFAFAAVPSTLGTVVKDVADGRYLQFETSQVISEYLDMREGSTNVPYWDFFVGTGRDQTSIFTDNDDKPYYYFPKIVSEYLDAREANSADPAGEAFTKAENTPPFGDGVNTNQNIYVVRRGPQGPYIDEDNPIIVGPDGTIVEPEDSTTVTDLALDEYIIAPVINETPITDPIDAPQYTSEEVQWFELDEEDPLADDAVFEEGKEYVAKVTLKAKTGYKLEGVEENSFTYTGAVVTNPANSGEVTITFPELGSVITGPTVTVDPDSRTIKPGEEAVYNVETTGIADNERGRLLWFSSEGDENPSLTTPDGLSYTLDPVSDSKTTLTIKADVDAVEGVYNFTIEIAGTSSGMLTLNIISEDKAAIIEAIEKIDAHDFTLVVDDVDEGDPWTEKNCRGYRCCSRTYRQQRNFSGGYKR